MRDLSIDRASRRHGFWYCIGGASHARRLLERAAARARQANCGAAFVDTFDPTALALYRRCGYEVVASLPDFPPGQRQYFLTKTLGPSDPPDRESPDPGG